MAQTESQKIAQAKYRNSIKGKQNQAKLQKRYLQSIKGKLTQANIDRRKRYNITPDDYNSLFAQQHGLCAICHNASDRSLNIDHDHNTGIIRGLLCHHCNLMLGHAKDDINILLSAIDYLTED